MKEDKFKSKLAWGDIENQCDLIHEFFKQIPDDIKAAAASYLIYEIVNWGCHDHFQALGIFEEAMLKYREASLNIMAELEDEDEDEDEDKLA